MTPRIVTGIEQKQWRQMRRAGKTIREIAEHAGRHWNTVERHLTEHAHKRQLAEGDRRRARHRAKKQEAAE
jgi:predicted transcriptional regulator